MQNAKWIKKICALSLAAMTFFTTVFPSGTVYAVSDTTEPPVENQNSIDNDSDVSVENRLKLKLEGFGGIVSVRVNGVTTSLELVDSTTVKVTSPEGVEENVTLQDGYCFVSENFEEGTAVEVIATPASGFEVSRYKILIDSGEESSEVFSAPVNDLSYMPYTKTVFIAEGGNTVDIAFKSQDDTTSTGSENSSGNNKSEVSESNQSGYNEETEESSSEGSFIEYEPDEYTKQLFESQLNTNYISSIEKYELIDGLVVKNSMFDGTQLQGYTSLDVMSDENVYPYAAIATLGAVVPVFNVNDDSEYYICLANTMLNDENYTVMDYDIAVKDLTGNVLEDCYYEDGIAYIKKDKCSLEKVGGIQIQLMQVTNTTDVQKSNYVVQTVDTSSEEGNVSAYGLKASRSYPYTIGSSNIFDLKVSVNTDPHIENIIVYVNGLPLDPSEFSYNYDTGELVIERDASSIASIKIESASADNENAINTLISAYNASDVDDLPEIHYVVASEVPEDLYEQLDSGKTVLYQGTLEYTYRDSIGDVEDIYMAWATDDDDILQRICDVIKSSGTLPITDVYFSRSEMNYLVRFLQLPGWTINQYKNNNSANGPVEIALKCGHVKDPFTDTPNTSDTTKRVKFYLRVLARNDSNHITVGIYSDTTHTQAGVGLFRMVVPRTTDLELTKKDANSKSALKGAKFTLYRWKDDTKSYDNKIGDFTDNGDGTYSYHKIPLGVNDSKGPIYFLVKETSAPAGYSKNYKKHGSFDESQYNKYGGRQYVWTASKGLQPYYYTSEGQDPVTDGFSFYDYSNPKELTIYKKDVNSKNALKGATFSLWTWTGSNGFDKKVGTFTDNGDGSYTIKNVSVSTTDPNHYFLVKEDKAPDGYDSSYTPNSDFDQRNQTKYGGRQYVYDANQDKIVVYDQDGASPVPDGFIFYDSPSSGSGKLVKKSANTTLTDGNSNYSISGAVYGVYSDSSCATEVGTLTVGADGTSNTLELKEGTYYVKEKTAPKGYVLDTTVHNLVITSGNTTTLNVSDTPNNVKINIIKQSGSSSTTNGNDKYSLKGAEYTVYYDSSCTQSAGKITTDANGKGSLSGLALGTYYVKETKAPAGFTLDTKVYTVDAKTGDTGNVTISKNVTSTESPNTVEIELTKSSKNATLTGSNNNYSLQGAVYTVYSDSACTKSVGTITTDSTGKGKISNLPLGIYYIKETTASKGFIVNTEKITVDASKGSTSTVVIKKSATSVETPNTVKIDLTKSSSNKTVTNGNNKYSLQGAEYTVYSNSACTKSVGKITTDSSGKGSISGLALGTYYVKETKASKGYTLDTKVYSVNATTGNATVEVVNKSVASSEVPSTVEITLTKKSGNTTLTNNNNNYSLKGAEYTVYKDSACTKSVGKITTDSTGSGKISNLPLGIYYIKETKASKGFIVNTEKITVDASTGSTSTAVVKKSASSTETPNTVTISLTKSSADPSCTNGNSNYSLQGAEYTVYSDSACTKSVGKITTDASGKGSISGLALGTYYVKETKASLGYSVNSEKITVDATTGNTSVAVVKKGISSAEKPKLDPISFLLYKEDPVNGGPVNGATLEGAEFTVKYYDEQMDTDPAKSGKTPDRTWVFTTVKTPSGKYGVMYDESCKVSGDDLYVDQFGDPAIPYGTVTIQETKAPNGYLINDKLVVVKMDGNSTGIDPVYHEPTIPEQSLDMVLTKKQSGTESVIQGAVFKHDGPNGFTENVTTDANGKATFKGLTHGNHTITEVSAPEGYSVNTQKITFTVADDNSIRITSNSTETDTNGTITVSVNSEGCIDATVYDKPAPYKLHLYKINNEDLALSGAEFTVYSDTACTQVVSSGKTDGSGNLTIPNLIPEKTYYLKETKAPKGYKIPVNSDGSDIVWKIKVSSDPSKNVFEFYVNGTKYTSSTGTYSVTGTKADRIVNMTVVNQIGAKLPNTGSSMMIILIIIGIVLMSGAIVVSKRHKRD